MSDVKIVIGADVSDLNRKLTQAGNITKDFAGKVQTGSNQATVALTNLGRVAQDSAFGFVGIANNLNPLLESFQRLRLETGSNKAALQALGSSLIGAGGIGLALSVVTSAVTFAQMGFSAWTRGLNENAKAAKEEASALKTVSDAIAREATDVFSLVTVLKSETETRKRKLDAIKELQQIQPEIFNGLKLEKDAVIGLDQAYQAYLKNLQDVVNAKILQAQIEKNLSRQFELQNILETAATYEKSITPLKDFSAASLEAAKAQRELVNERIRTLNIFGQNITIPQATAELDNLKKNFEGLAQKLFDVSGGIKVKAFKIKPEKVEVDPNTLERGLGSLFPPGKVIAPPPGYEPSIKLQNIKLNPPDEVKLDVGFAEKILEAVRKEIFRAQLEENINGLLKDVFAGAFVGIGEAIGNAITGSDIGDAFNSIFKILGTGLKQLGVFVIAQSKLLAQIKATIAKAPALAIPLGLALVALGTVIQNAIVKKTPGFATGVRGFDGGLALVGERGPELVRLPKGSDVIPNGQIGGFGGGIDINIDWILRGADMYALIKRQEMVNKRNY